MDSTIFVTLCKWNVFFGLLFFVWTSSKKRRTKRMKRWCIEMNAAVSALIFKKRTKKTKTIQIVNTHRITIWNVENGNTNHNNHKQWWFFMVLLSGVHETNALLDKNGVFCQMAINHVYLSSSSSTSSFSDFNAVCVCVSVYVSQIDRIIQLSFSSFSRSRSLTLGHLDKNYITKMFSFSLFTLRF